MKYVVILSSKYKGTKEDYQKDSPSDVLVTLEEAASYRLKEGEKFFFNWPMDKGNISRFLTKDSEESLICDAYDFYQVMIIKCPSKAARKTFQQEAERLLSLLF